MAKDLKMLITKDLLRFYYNEIDKEICVYFFLFSYFCLCWVFVAAHSLSLTSGGYSNCRAQASHRAGFSSCGARAPRLWCTGLVILQHVESFWTRD